jgi:hypothetical protein
MQNEGRVFLSLVGATANDFVLTERVRTEILYVRSAPVPFPVQ